MWGVIAILILMALVATDSLLRLSLAGLRIIISRNILRTFSSAGAGSNDGCVVLIAARDEAELIGPTVAALLPQLSEWPGSVVNVIADRCQDLTAQTAQLAGASVAVRTNGRSGKCAAIDWWLQTYREVWQSRQAVIVLDADSRLSPGSLIVFKAAIENGADAAQAFLAPQSDSRSGRLSGWSEILMQRLDDEARHRCGWQVPLRGTGMAFRADMLAELAPKLHTMAEDLELDVLLAERRANVVFVSDAVVFDPKPQHSAGAARQRARWLRGQLQVLRDYWRAVVHSLQTGGLSAWFLLPLLFLRPKTLFIALRLSLVLAGIASELTFSAEGSWLRPLLFSAGCAAAIGLLLDFSYYLMAVLIVDDRRKYLTDLLAAPRYFAMWLYSLGVMAVRRGWLRARG